jgi:hypothetical protein
MICSKYYADGTLQCVRTLGHGKFHATGNGAEWPDSSCAPWHRVTVGTHVRFVCHGTMEIPRGGFLEIAHE